MFDVPFGRDRVYRDPPTKAMQAKLDDYERRMATRLRQPLYTPAVDRSRNWIQLSGFSGLLLFLLICSRVSFGRDGIIIVWSVPLF